MARHINTIRRIERVKELTAQYYEPGVHAKCYRAVWKRHIYNVYPMCYRTYLSYIATRKATPADTRQLTLF